MKRALLIAALLIASVGATLTPGTAEARWGYRGYRYARPYYSYSYGYRPYGYYNYGYSRPYYYNSYRPYYYNSYRPYYYNTYRPYYGGYYRPGVRVYGPGVGVWVR
jgi:hypothetical protein